ncbi:hypothetical protein IHN63_00070 [Deinococcus sp. 6YEL10]|uniref:hypothetical protein n=1 Tax=Deinococcus sp. 6YEL10 TaxID=2745870 RepID=UPI001E4BBD22|nr:hypothetical protein [Deinococcus sp. 6YEL10]MCD0159693.1 hypothetical protein [Deinococcus sp. 6YEL10]
MYTLTVSFRDALEPVEYHFTDEADAWTTIRQLDHYHVATLVGPADEVLWES